MTKITDFQFNMQIICFTLNITGKSYAKKILYMDSPDRFYVLPGSDFD